MHEFLEHLKEEFSVPLSNPVLIFSLVLFIILLSPILFRRLKIPGIIVLIISGIIIGPHGLHLLKKSSAIELFSTIGLLYIMFIAGLELDLNEFKKNKYKSLGFGLLTFILPLSIGFPVCYYLLDYSMNASLLVASMFATHTLVAYPIVSKMGISKSQAVAITVGGTILTDTAVLIVLAVIMGHSQGNLTQEFWIRLSVSLLLFGVIMFVAIPRFAKWFFSKLESEKHSHYIFVLSIVFFAAFLAEVAGVEPIIGAFVAGLALNPLIPHSSALMNRIEFIGNALFIPFFLISVGMIVDLKVIFSGATAWIVAGTLTVVAISGKWLAAFFTQLLFRYTKGERQLIFGLSSSHAAATLAIIMVGFNAGILDENILNGTIILVLVTCIVASFVTERAARQILLNSGEEAEDRQMEGPETQHILIPIADFTRLEKLLDLATLLKEKKAASPITILTIVPNNEEAEQNINKVKKLLEPFVLQASASENRLNAIASIDHNIVSGITRVSREIMANVLLMGWPHRSGIIDKLIGERLESLLQSSNKTILLCHFSKPLVIHKRLLVFCPPLAENEPGFSEWLSLVDKLAVELTKPVLYCCNEKTEKAIARFYRKSKFRSELAFHRFKDWEDFLVLSKIIRDEDILILVSARKASVSHMNLLDNLPAKIEKHFPGNSRIVIYPQQNIADPIHEAYLDTSSEPLSKGIETIQHLGKEIGSIFRKGEEPRKDEDNQ